MPIQVEVPGHGLVEFPDGMTDDQIAGAIKQNMSFPDPQKQGSNFGGRLAQGLIDPVVGMGQLTQHALPDSIRQKATQEMNAMGAPMGASVQPGQLDQQIAQREQEYQAERRAQGSEGIDWARLLGNVVSPANLALMKVPGASSLPKLMASGAGVGGASAAMQPVTQGDFDEEKTAQIQTGAGFGAAAAPVANALGRVINPQTRPEAKALLAEDVRLTPGQILGGMAQKIEDKAQSLPFVGDMIANARGKGLTDFNRAAYARALKGTGVDPKSLPVGREGIDAVKKAVSEQYDSLLPKLSFKPDGKFDAEVSELRTLVQQLPEKEAKRFEDILQRELLSRSTPQGNLNGEALKTVESQLGKQASNFQSSTDAYQRDLGDALSQLQQNIRNALVRQNPEYAKELAQANSNYANYVRLRNAGSRAGDQSGGFSVAQLAAAVKGADKSAGKGGVATGNALMQDLSDAAVSAMGSKVPDSGTAGRLMMGGAAGGAAFIEPTLAAGVAASSLPYTDAGRRIAQMLLTSNKLPKSASAPTIEALRKALPIASGSLVPRND